MGKSETMVWLKDIFGATGDGWVCLIQKRESGKLYHTYYKNDEGGLMDLCTYALKVGNKDHKPSDMYVRLTPTKTDGLRSQGKKEDTLFSLTLWAEIDDAKSIDITAIKPEPSYIIRSGGGFHLYWVFINPIADYTLVEGYNRTIVSSLRKLLPDHKIDSIFDCTRFLRIPHTKNYKSKDAPRPVDIYHRGKKYMSVSQLNIEPTKYDEYVTGEITGSVESLGKRKVDDYVGDWGVQLFDVESNPYLKEHVETSVPDRSSHDFKVAVYMVKNGYKANQIRYVLTRAGFSTSEKYQERAKVSEHSARYYVDTTIRNAWTTANIDIHLDENGKKLNFKSLADMILENNNFMLYGKDVLRYEDGVYKPYDRLNAQIITTLGDRYSIRTLNEISKYCTELGTPRREDLQFREKAICFLNGVYDLEEKEFIEHSPMHYFISQFPVMFGKRFEKKGGREKVLTFLEEILGTPERVKTFLEYTSSIFYPGEYKPKKFLILIGETDAGKSTLMNFLSGFAGGYGAYSSVCYTSFQQIVKESQFRLADFHGKLFNIQPDLSGSEAPDISVIKQLTGDDVIIADRKNTSALSFYNRARIFMPANNMPVVRSGDEAFYKRMIIIPVQPKFKVSKPNILREMKEYYPEFLGLLLDAYNDLEERDFKVYTDRSDEGIINDFLRESDPIADFIHLHLRVAGTEKDFPTEKWTPIIRERIYPKYRRYCHNAGRLPVNATNFNKRLREIERKNGVKYDRVLKRNSPCVHPLMDAFQYITEDEGE